MANATLTAAIEKVCTGTDLGADEAGAALTEIMEGRSSEAETAGLLTALRTKGETVEEVAGLAGAMRALATPVDVSRDGLVDTAGTGGGLSTFNVSTAAGIVAAGAGAAVAKHGNRSNTSRCGSADLLEALGVRIDLAPDAVARSIEEIGFGFMFAPAHHAAMKHVVPVRRELGVRTVFNFLGPLTNPAGAARQIVGVADRDFQDVVAGALALLGAERAWVVTADDGLDELSVFAPSRVLEVSGGEVRELAVDPEVLGVAHPDPAAVAGGEPADNAETVLGVLAGDPGAAADLVALNAAAAIMLAGRADSLELGLERARESISSGRAREVLDRLREQGDGNGQA